MAPDETQSEQLRRVVGGAGEPREQMWRVHPDRALQAHLGLEVDVDADGNLIARLPVADHVKQPMGIVHGGVYAVIAETLASVGTARDVMQEGKLALGQSNNTAFFRPVTEGTIRATATRRHRGRTSQVWQVDMFDDDGRLAASSTVTIAVRAPDPGR